MATKKTYSFCIRGTFSADSYLLATSTMLDTMKNLPSMQLQQIELVEWTPTPDPIEENNVVVEEATLTQEEAIKAAEVQALSL